ncbi:MAG: hypothetical protein H7A23_17770 [Leptospiraceae bacterium]|nr:hypothetical protein [Leptospiraceae bacterium]MCP5496399.1 hypothetical protein [Leptospiraceae bacterium]
MKRLLAKILVLTFLFEVVSYAGTLPSIDIVFKYFGFNHKIILINQENFQKSGHWNLEITSEMFDEFGEISICDSRKGEETFQKVSTHSELNFSPYVYLLQTLFYQINKLYFPIQYSYSWIHYYSSKYSLVSFIPIEEPPETPFV